MTDIHSKIRELSESKECIVESRPVPVPFDTYEPWKEDDNPTWEQGFHYRSVLKDGSIVESNDNCYLTEWAELGDGGAIHWFTGAYDPGRFGRFVMSAQSIRTE